MGSPPERQKKSESTPAASAGKQDGRGGSQASPATGSSRRDRALATAGGGGYQEQATALAPDSDVLAPSGSAARTSSGGLPGSPIRAFNGNPDGDELHGPPAPTTRERAEQLLLRFEDVLQKACEMRGLEPSWEARREAAAAATNQIASGLQASIESTANFMGRESSELLERFKLSYVDSLLTRLAALPLKFVGPGGAEAGMVLVQVKNALGISSHNKKVDHAQEVVTFLGAALGKLNSEHAQEALTKHSDVLSDYAATVGSLKAFYGAGQGGIGKIRGSEEDVAGKAQKLRDLLGSGRPVEEALLAEWEDDATRETRQVMEKHAELTGLLRRLDYTAQRLRTAAAAAAAAGNEAITRFADAYLTFLADKSGSKALNVRAVAMMNHDQWVDVTKGQTTSADNSAFYLTYYGAEFGQGPVFTEQMRDYVASRNLSQLAATTNLIVKIQLVGGGEATLLVIGGSTQVLLDDSAARRLALFSIGLMPDEVGRDLSPKEYRGEGYEYDRQPQRAQLAMKAIEKRLRSQPLGSTRSAAITAL